MAAQGYRGEPETKTKEDESNASLYIAVSMYIYFTVGTKGPWVMAFHQRRDDDDENKHAVGHRRNWTDVVVLGKNEMRAESASREPRKKNTLRGCAKRFRSCAMDATSGCPLASKSALAARRPRSSCGLHGSTPERSLWLWNSSMSPEAERRKSRDRHGRGALAPIWLGSTQPS